MQFTYTFPPLLRLGYDVITDAMTEDEVYAPGKGTSGRIDKWSQWSRWRRVSFHDHQILFKCQALMVPSIIYLIIRDFSVGGGTTSFLTWW
jgi:hypothetical protein